MTGQQLKFGGFFKLGKKRERAWLHNKLNELSFHTVKLMKNLEEYKLQFL